MSCRRRASGSGLLAEHVWEVERVRGAGPGSSARSAESLKMFFTEYVKDGKEQRDATQRKREKRGSNLREKALPGQGSYRNRFTAW